MLVEIERFRRRWAKEFDAETKAARFAEVGRTKMLEEAAAVEIHRAKGRLPRRIIVNLCDNK
jgi:hypothetical protein